MEVSPGPLERRVVGGLVKTLMMPGRRRAPAPPPAHLESRDLAFEGNTGARLAGRWFPAEKPRGVVALAHPDKRAGKHWFVASGWVDHLHAEGFDVLTFDFPGYGASRGPATYYHEDVVAAAELARAWSGLLPVHLVGVSMGAFAVANASPRLPWVKSITLESPYPSFNAWYAKGPRRAIMDGFDRAFPASSRAIQADANVARAAPSRVLVALAEDDRVTPPALTEAVFRAAPKERSRLVRVKGGHLSAIADEGFRAALRETLG
jgi:pimeloyl-ACP methyl ester carboxylesterase